MSEQLDIEAIRARLADVPEGPWRDEVDGETGNLEVHIADNWSIYFGEMETSDKSDHALARYFAHSRTDIPALLSRVAELEAGLRPFVDTYDTYQRVIKEPGYGPLFSLDGATYEFQRAWELLNGTQQGSESSESGASE